MNTFSSPPKNKSDKISLHDNSSLPAAELIPIFVKLPPEEIVSIKFTVESYDGLGIVRTLNPQTGEVVILATEDSVEDVKKLLKSLKNSLNLRIIPPPPCVQGDWLLAEMFSDPGKKESRGESE